MHFSSFPTHRERSAQLAATYDAWIESGEYIPWTYPFGSLGAFIVLVYLLIPHQKSPLLKRARFLAWALNFVIAFYCISCTRARGAPTAYGVGLGSAWSIVWFTACLVAYDAQDDFCRIEFAKGATGTVTTDDVNTDELSESTNGRMTHEPENGHVDKSMSSPGQKPDKSTRVWQCYPGLPFAERLDWILDLLMNFRGMGWNWRIPILPPPPKNVREQLRKTETATSRKFEQRSSITLASHVDKAELLRTSLQRFVVGYLILDVAKTLAIRDPYFSTYVDAPAPSYLPTLIKASPVLSRCYRLLLGLSAIYWALATIFALGPMFFVGVLGSDKIGVRGEPWMYPAEWGSYTSVLDRGLAGWWGMWWHQTFRFGFEAPSRRVLERLGLDPRSVRGKAVALFLSFAISGFLHASGSYTSIGDTRPIRGTYSFFLLQPFGIMLQMLVSGWLKSLGLTDRIPKVVRRAANFAYVHVWMYWTAPLFVGDLAAGGTFLYEPCPVSFMRALGFGLPGDSWWTWGGRWVTWYSGKHWWQSGIAT